MPKPNALPLLSLRIERDAAQAVKKDLAALRSDIAQPRKARGLRAAS